MTIRRKMQLDVILSMATVIMFSMSAAAIKNVSVDTLRTQQKTS